MIMFALLALLAFMLATWGLCLHVGYRWGRTDTAPPDLRRPPLEGEHPYPEREMVAFDAAMSAWLAEDHAPRDERLATSADCGGVLFDLGPDPLTDTGELRALAYAGDLDTIKRQIDQAKKDIDNA
jgi:hypothetical protein